MPVDHAPGTLHGAGDGHVNVQVCLLDENRTAPRRSNLDSAFALLPAHQVDGDAPDIAVVARQSEVDSFLDVAHQVRRERHACLLDSNLHSRLISTIGQNAHFDK